MVIDQRPLPVKQSVTTNEGVPVTITLQATDADGDALTYSVFRPPLHGKVTLAGNQATYTPDSFFLGAERGRP